MLPEARLERLPRMADFALWMWACETAIWPVGTFWSAYCRNQARAVENVIDADPVAAALRGLMSARTMWTGTATDLLDALSEEAGERATRSRLWPNSLQALSGRLRRAATFLRKVGVEFDFDREGRSRTRIIHIFWSTESAALAASASSASAANSAPADGSAANHLVKTDLRCLSGADADGADEKIPQQSGWPF